MSYALIDERGTVLKTVKVPILEVKKGERISFMTTSSITAPKDRGEVTEFFHYKGCQAKLEKRVTLTQNLHCYHIEVVGTNPLDVEKVIGEMMKLIGIKDVSLAKAKLGLSFDLPELRSVFQRMKFLCWDYIFHGKVAYYPGLSQEELDRQYDKTMDDYEKEETEKVNRQIDEDYDNYQEEEREKREKEIDEERNQEREEEDYPEDDIPIEVNFDDDPGGFKGYE